MGGAAGAGARAAAAGGGSSELFETYRDAMMATGQDTSGLTPAKLQAAIRKQEAEIKKKLGCDRVDFSVVVQNGKVKLKAAAG
ncbi:MAG: MXAN_5187 C-terminal domain-containing protein [Myxococcota bacterium]